MKPGVLQDLAELREPLVVARVDRIDLLLRLRDVASGFSRPIICQLLLCRQSSDFSRAVNAAGTQTSMSFHRNLNPRGSTPTIV